MASSSPLRVLVLLAVLPLAAEASFGAIPLLRLAADVVGGLSTSAPSAPAVAKLAPRRAGLPVSAHAPIVLREEPPWFCHGIDCPVFQVDSSFEGTLEGVERRTYLGVTKWASVSVKGVSYDKAVYTGFMKLFDYISGANESKQKIPMTAPVRVRLVPAAGPTCENEFIVSFFVPFDFQESTPLPTDESVFIEQQGPFTVYVASYGGFSSQDKVVTHASDLAGALSDLAIDIQSDFYFSASYDPPFRLFKRHNEVWIMEAEPKQYDNEQRTAFSKEQVAAYELGVDSLRGSTYSYSDDEDPLLGTEAGSEEDSWEPFWEAYPEVADVGELPESRFEYFSTEETTEEWSFGGSGEGSDGDPWSEPTYWDKVFHVFENRRSNVWADDDDDDSNGNDMEVPDFTDLWADYDGADCDDNEEEEDEDAFAKLLGAVYQRDGEEDEEDGDEQGISFQFEDTLDEDEEDDEEDDEDEDEDDEDEDDVDEEDEEDEMEYESGGYTLESLARTFGSRDMARLMSPRTEVITKRTDVYVVVDFASSGDGSGLGDVNEMMNRVMDMLNL
mmetsp:Transcript_11538/g.32730  ORF Transcript_11538/g.32730 Transcript_11538/m.32730 type:complete len:558 (-) Transcript_11538:66-1739(-)|eukprot:CAMPEP_0117665886 /NCGR_PEP_ID=MMETSP0804-20121206/10063_1 /TAXON_ID=1074897 /ORGANISM="Tetraselmis astigmatica, Strain CCMP880" /LENGTH=557 /DNA_ID=CAMNT_0005473357 /DNA_START=252 /DNA_END=1925 /DNA_ORIENTATION=-